MSQKELYAPREDDVVNPGEAFKEVCGGGGLMVEIFEVI